VTYAVPPDRPPALEDCYFYHCMDVPGYGTVGGEWDLRGRADEYLGHVDLSGLRVLEIGTASGFLCFEMERRGAEVVACDLSPAQSWDVVPVGGLALDSEIDRYRQHVGRINNGYWLAHRAYGSRARVVYTDAYSVPAEIGEVDATVFASVLLHVRDPFLALQRGLAHTTRLAIVTDVARAPLESPVVQSEASRPSSWREAVARRLVARVPPAPSRSRPRVTFMPGAESEGIHTWWQFEPEAISGMLAVLGFRTDAVTFHTERSIGGPFELFTVVASRTTRS
jgi:SAM-dependent methyltransferase